MMSKFKAAGVPETLRSWQKDEQYLHHMRTLLADSVQGSLGVRHWLKWNEIYDMFSDFTYFLLTTLSSLQTLGEEYVHVVQVDSSLRKLPSAKRRFVWVIVHVFGPIALRRAQKYLEKKIMNSSSTSLEGLKRQAQLLKALQFLFWLLLLLHKLNLIVFYFKGNFYHLSKRLTGIRYVLIRRWLSQQYSDRTFRILGIITAAQFCISLFMDIRKFCCAEKSDSLKEDIHCDSGDSEELIVQDQCTLCLGKRKQSTITPCGHLFCWYCIASWLQKKEECPLCRESFGPSRLVYLQNYT